MTIGDNIKELAIATNKSMAMIAKEAGLNRSQLSRCAHDDVSMNLGTFLKVARAYPNFVWDFGDIKVVTIK